jgi:hypothetical protein
MFRFIEIRFLVFLNQEANYWGLVLKCYELRTVAEPPELFQLKCLSHASGAVTHLNWNNPSVPQI